MRKPYWPILYRLVDKVSKTLFVEIMEKFDQTSSQPFDLRKEIDVCYFFLIVEADQQEEFYPEFPAGQFYDLAKRQLRSGGYITAQKIKSNLDGCGFNSKEEIDQYGLKSLIFIKQFTNEVIASSNEPVY